MFRKVLTLTLRVALALVVALLMPFLGAVLSGLAVDSLAPGYGVQAGVTFVLVLLLQAILYAVPLEAVADTREEGVVKWFNGAKGFGFISREGADDVFVHFRSIRGRGHRTLHEGQRVRFGVVDSAKGLQAEDVSVIHHQ